MDWNFGNYKVEWKVRLGLQQRKLEEKETARTAETDDLLTGSESHLEDGASVPSLRQTRKQRKKSMHAAWKQKIRKQKEGRRKMERVGK